MNFKRRVKFLLALCSLLTVSLSALPQPFEKLSVENGLSNHVVFSIKQYHKGAMWFSTKLGIDKYDGLTFKHYNLYPDEDLFQFGQRHSRLHTDQYGRFWARNNFDIFLYSEEKDIFESIYSNRDATIRDFLVLDTHTFLIATDQGLLKFNSKTQKIKRYPKLQNAVYRMSRYDGNLVLLVERYRILSFDSQTDIVGSNILKPALLKALNHKTITALCVDSSKSIFVGSTGRVIAFNLGDSVARFSNELSNRLKNSTVRTIISKGKEIFVGTDGSGVHKATSELKLLSSFISDPDNSATINDNSVNDIFIDDNKRIWIAGMGINFYDPNKLKFHYHKHHINDPNSLTNNYVRSIVEDSEGKIWVGTKYGISIFNRKSNSWKHIKPQSITGVSAGGDILSLAKHKNGNILVGTYKNGLYTIDKNLKITKIPASNGRSIYSLLTYDEQVWAGTSSAALWLKNTQAVPYKSNYALSLARTINGEIIIGGHDGLTVISPNGKTTNYNYLKYKIGSIFSVKIDRKGRIWCGSEGQGLIRFDDRKKTFIKYTAKNGLPSNIVYGILEDLQGNLWLSTTNGLSCFNPENEKFKNYSATDGLKIKEFNYGAAAATSKGELIFGGLNGFVLFNPEEITSINVKKHLVFTDFKIFNISSNVGKNNSPLQKVIDETDTISLRYDQNSISFDFTSINLTNVSTTQYSWMLEGLDKTWSPLGNAHTASYTNLGPGEYVFRLKSTNNPPEFSDPERKIFIMIAPPFWKTSWAYLVYLITCVAIVYFIIKFYHVQISEEHAKDKVNFFINIAHDIRTPLSLIRSPLSVAIKNNDFSDRTLRSLKTADQNAERLSVLINQLLEFEKAENNKMELDLVPIYIEELLNELCASFVPFLEEKNIALIKNFHRLNTHLLIDRDKFEKIIFNLLSNAIKYTPSNGRIEISTYIVSNNYLIQVSDTGLGIPLEQQKSIFKRHFRAQNALNSNETGSGIGLMLTKKLVEQHNGSISFESIEGKGSTFKVLLPFIPYSTTKMDIDASGHTSTSLNLSDESLSAPKKGYKLLIAEDHFELRQHLVENLSEFYNIYQAGDGKEALELTKKVYPDIILSDVMMPRMDGNQFCYEVKNNIETSHIPVILLTSLTDTQFKIEGLKTGADIYLEKPFDLELVKTCIDNLLKNRKRLKEKFLKTEMSVNDDLSELDKSFIDKGIRIIEANLSNSSFSIDDLQQEMGMSHAALYRKFRSLVGKTPLEFVNQYRLKRAAELLKQGQYNVNEVAYMVGFSNPKYFSTSFKKLFGENASDYKGK